MVLPRVERFLGERGRFFVADLGGERRDHHQRLVDQLAAALFVDFQAGEQLVDEHVRYVGQQFHGFQEGVDHHRHGDVQLEQRTDAAEGGGGDDGVVAEDAAGDLHRRFGDDRVHFAGHDRGAGLRGGQRELEDAAARAGAEQADVVGDFGERDGDGFQLAVGFDE